MKNLEVFARTWQISFKQYAPLKLVLYLQHSDAIVARSERINVCWSKRTNPSTQFHTVFSKMMSRFVLPYQLLLEFLQRRQQHAGVGGTHPSSKLGASFRIIARCSEVFCILDSFESGIRRNYGVTWGQDFKCMSCDCGKQLGRRYSGTMIWLAATRHHLMRRCNWKNDIAFSCSKSVASWVSKITSCVVKVCKRVVFIFSSSHGMAGRNLMGGRRSKTCTH